jgi:hypothetical protein
MNALLTSIGLLHDNRVRAFRTELQPFLETTAGHRYQYSLLSQTFPAQHIFAFPPFHDRHGVFESRTTPVEPSEHRHSLQIQNMLLQLTAHILNIEDNTVQPVSFLHFHTNNFHIEFTPMGGAMLFMTITAEASAPPMQSMLHTLDRLLNTTDIREPV